MTDQSQNLPAPKSPQEYSSVVKRTGAGSFSMVPRNFAEAMQFSKILAEASICPEAFRGKPGDVMVVMQMAFELDIMPMQALQNICVINGRPTVWGDLVVALVQRSGQLEFIERDWDEAKQCATVRVKRRGVDQVVVEKFSMADAKRAGLDGKQTYKQYPQRMCMWRALTFALRFLFADVLKGLQVADEVMDFPAIVERPAPPKPINAPRPTTVDVDPPQLEHTKAHDATDATKPGDDLGWKEFSQEDASARADQVVGDPSGQTTLPGADLSPDARDPERLPPLTVVSVTKAASGVDSKTQKPWTSWWVEFSDGRRVKTYDVLDFNNAEYALTNKLPVTLKTKIDKRTSETLIDELEKAKV